MLAFISMLSVGIVTDAFIVFESKAVCVARLRICVVCE